jgi:hypothetical protein
MQLLAGRLLDDLCFLDDRDDAERAFVQQRVHSYGKRRRRWPVRGIVRQATLPG